MHYSAVQKTEWIQLKFQFFLQFLKPGSGTFFPSASSVLLAESDYCYLQEVKICSEKQVCLEKVLHYFLMKEHHVLQIADKLNFYHCVAICVTVDYETGEKMVT